ncbi:MAG TPA: hypothetical protein VF033_07480 [Steroidobacteraceae bacterium]
MSKYRTLISILIFILIAPIVRSQQSLQALHARIPAPPATAAAAAAWLASPEYTTLARQLKDQRAFVEKLSQDASVQSAAGMSSGAIDFARAQRDPAYAQELQKKIQSMSQDEQMKLAMQMSQATQAQALQDVKAMAADPDAVKLAAEHWPDYQMKQAAGGIQSQQTAVGDLQRKVSTRAMQISEQASKKLKCSDGEGSCPAADQAADQATLKAAHAQIIAEYDVALVQIGQQFAAARKARAADIAAVQKDLAPARYGAAAQSSANKQILAAYHNAALMEVEQLFSLSEDAAKWAVARVKDRTVNFMPID